MNPLSVASRSAPAHVVQDRAMRMASAILQIITAKPKTTTTELREQLTSMFRDEIADIQRQIASDIRQSE